MSVIDLKHTIDRMLNEKYGVSDNTIDNKPSNSLQDLRNNLDQMLSIRSGDKTLSTKYCPQHQGTTCDNHSYQSYSAFQQSIKSSDATISLKSLDNAISNTTYCTCDARMAAGCTCQLNLQIDQCRCNARTVITCDCQGRTSGKYGPPRCNCDARTGTNCACVARNASISCTCDGRCSCNVVKEFSMSSPNRDCACNTEIISDCSCNTRAYNACTAHHCGCYARSATSRIDSQHWNLSYVSYCDANYDETYKTVNLCHCVSRCSCNSLQRLKQ